MAKTILKLYGNGDFETVGATLIQSGIEGNYSFNENLITVPKIIEYSLALEDLPEWAVDTGHPISIFKEGILIKGDLIQSNN